MYELEEVKRTSLFFSALKSPVRRELVKMAENPSSFKKLYENLGNYGIELKYMSSLHRQLATLVEADLLEKYHDGARYLYRSKLKQAALDLGTMKFEFENTDSFPTEVLDENRSGLVLEALDIGSGRDILSVVSASEAPLNAIEICKILQSRGLVKYKYYNNLHFNHLTKLVESGLLDKYYDRQAGKIVYAPTAEKVFVNGRLEIGLEANGRGAGQGCEVSDIDAGKVIQSLSSDLRRYLVKLLFKRPMRLEEIHAVIKENGYRLKHRSSLYKEAEKLVKSDVLGKYYDKDSGSMLYKSDANQIIINLKDSDITVGVTDVDLAGYGSMREEFKRNDTGLILRALNSPLNRFLIKILTKEKMSTKEALEAVNMAGFDLGFRENIHNIYNILNLLRKAGLVEKYHVPDKKEFVYTTNLDGILIDMNSTGTLLLRK